LNWSVAINGDLSNSLSEGTAFLRFEISQKRENPRPTHPMKSIWKSIFSLFGWGVQLNRNVSPTVALIGTEYVVYVRYSKHQQNPGFHRQQKEHLLIQVVMFTALNISCG